MTSLGKAMAGRTRHRVWIRVQPREIFDEYLLNSKLDFNVPAGDSWAYRPREKSLSAASVSCLRVAAEGHDKCGARAAQPAGCSVTAMSEVEYLGCLPYGPTLPPANASASGPERISDATLLSGRGTAGPLALPPAATSVLDRSVAAEAALDPPGRADTMLPGSHFCMGRDA